MAGIQRTPCASTAGTSAAAATTSRVGLFAVAMPANAPSARSCGTEGTPASLRPVDLEEQQRRSAQDDVEEGVVRHQRVLEAPAARRIQRGRAPPSRAARGPRCAAADSGRRPARLRRGPRSARHWTATRTGRACARGGRRRRPAPAASRHALRDEGGLQHTPRPPPRDPRPAPSPGRSSGRRAARSPGRGTRRPRRRRTGAAGRRSPRMRRARPASRRSGPCPCCSYWPGWRFFQIQKKLVVRLNSVDPATAATDASR